MTNLLKTIAITTAVFGASITAAHASDSFTARFDYNSSQSANTNLERFETQAEELCDAQMKAAGFRKSEGRFERRKCRKDVVAQAVKLSNSPALRAEYEAKGTSTRATRTQQAQK